MTRYHALIRDGAVEMREGTPLPGSPFPASHVNVSVDDGNGAPYRQLLSVAEWNADWHPSADAALAALRARCRDEVERAEAALRDARARLGVVEGYSHE